MLYVKQIQELFDVDVSFAHEIMDRMVLDFSEASQEEFEAEAQFAMDMFLADIL